MYGSLLINAIPFGPGLRREVVRYLRGDRHKMIPIDRMRCVTQHFAMTQGYAGQPIDKHPVYGFFKLCKEDRKKAEQAFSVWLWSGLAEIETWKLGLSNDGKITGSLARILERLHAERGLTFKSISSTDPGLMREAIQVRVSQYMDLFDSIARDGFKTSWKTPITCYRTGSRSSPTYIIKNGHHRVAIMKVLGHERMPALVLAPKERRVEARSAGVRWNDPRG